jgi:hypothetical protein
MRLFVASGYYDLATPYFATDYTLTHLGLDPSQKGRISTSQYEAGHMMYISTRELARLKGDVAKFIQGALSAAPPRIWPRRPSPDICDAWGTTIHVTRGHKKPIAEAEWRTYVAGDPELELTGVAEATDA